MRYVSRAPFFMGELSRDGLRSREITALVRDLCTWRDSLSMISEKRGGTNDTSLCLWPEREIPNGITSVWMQMCKK